MTLSLRRLARGPIEGPFFSTGVSSALFCLYNLAVYHLQAEPGMRQRAVGPRLALSSKLHEDDTAPIDAV